MGSAVAEEGTATRDIADAIGAGLGLPVTAVDPVDALDHFGWLGMFFSLDLAASGAHTRGLLGWQPAAIGLFEDLAQGHYFAAADQPA